ncbi:hypothetical protein M513_04340 [Trichuris suis]|uniref:Uncharacterized protein n=1 Tax=Trichuris suis TaxID=68888 RepID=A0A085MBP4_9BILA|nr:hypothetical protein M513_04340 [Trichuris suis]
MLSLLCWHVSSSCLRASPRASFVRHMFLPGTFPFMCGHIVMIKDVHVRRNAAWIMLIGKQRLHVIASVAVRFRLFESQRHFLTAGPDVHHEFLWSSFCMLYPIAKKTK